MSNQEAIKSFEKSNEQAKARLEVEKMRMDMNEVKELEFYIERDEMAIKALEQEPNKEAYNQGYEDGYLAGQKNIAERFEGLIKSGISTDTPDDIKYVIGLLNELSSANPEDPETEIEELDFVQEHKKIPVTLQVQKYCDRNICVSNEYNGISCNECEVTKSQNQQESEDKNEHYIPIQSLCGDINDIIDES